MISRCIELSMGSGRDRKLKGSKRALMCPHVLHFTWDLSWPWKRSTTMERFLRRWFSHACGGGHTNTDGFGDYNRIVVAAKGGWLRLRPPTNQKFGGSVPLASRLNPLTSKSLAFCVAATVKRPEKCCLLLDYFPLWTLEELPSAVMIQQKILSDLVALLVLITHLFYDH